MNLSIISRNTKSALASDEAYGSWRWALFRAGRQADLPAGFLFPAPGTTWRVLRFSIIACRPPSARAYVLRGEGLVGVIYGYRARHTGHPDAGAVGLMYLSISSCGFEKERFYVL